MPSSGNYWIFRANNLFYIDIKFSYFFPWYSILYSTLRFWEKKMKSSRYSTVPPSWASSGGTPHWPATWELFFCLCRWPQAGQGGFPCQGLDKISYLVGSHTLLLLDTKIQFGHRFMKRELKATSASLAAHLSLLVGSFPSGLSFSKKLRGSHPFCSSNELPGNGISFSMT